MKPRVFLGSSGQQEKLLQALTRGLEEIADVDPWMTVFNPGVSTLERLVELTHEVDFAAFVFAQDDWTTRGASPDAASGVASPRDNVVFEAGLFGGALGIRRTFILHANGAKLPTDLLGLTSIRYDPDTTPAIVRQINQKLRKAIEAEGRISRLEGDWWQLSLTARTELEPSSISLLTISRGRGRRAGGRGTGMAGRRHAVRRATGARHRRNESIRPASSTSGMANVPVIQTLPNSGGSREIKLESVDRAGGYWTTRSDGPEPSTHGPPGSTSVQTRVTGPCSTATTRPSGRHSSSGVSRSGGRWRTTDCAASAPVESQRPLMHCLPGARGVGWSDSKRGGIAMAVTAARTVREAMHEGCECIDESQMLVDAAKRMEELDVGVLPICGSDDRLKGMLTDRDIVVKAIAEGRDPATTSCGEFAQGTVHWIAAEASFDEALSMMREHAVKRLCVMDENKRLTGIITEADVATHAPEAATGELVGAIAAKPPQHF